MTLNEQVYFCQSPGVLGSGPHLGDFGIWPGPDGRDYLARLDVALAGRIWHLPRGHRWRWHGRDWLALGGAVSLDRAVRTAGVNW